MSIEDNTAEQGNPEEIQMNEPPTTGIRGPKFFNTEKITMFYNNMTERMRVFGESLFARQRKNIVEETSSPTAEVFSSSSDVIERYPFITQHVSISEVKDVDDRSRMRRHQRIEETVMHATIVYDRIKEQRLILEEKRDSTLEKRIRIKKNRSLPQKNRIYHLVCLDLREEIHNLYEKFLDEEKQNVSRTIKYVNLLHMENPDLEIKIQASGILNRLSYFPAASPQAMELKRFLAAIKPLAKDVPFSLIGHITITKRLSKILCDCEAIYNPQLGYFEECSATQSEFQTVMEHMSQDFIKRMNIRIFKCMSEPTIMGDLLLEQCADLAKVKKFDREKTTKYFFLLYTRLFFSQIYEKSFSMMSVSADTEEFHRRIRKLRRLTPAGIGFGAKFIPPHLREFRIMDIPDDNMYAPAVSIFSQLGYIICPIDFSKLASDALSMIQSEAKSLAFSEKTKETHQIVSESEQSLCIDELFDITLLVFLMADTCDIYTLVMMFGGYIKALQMPSALEFAFTNMKALCEHIMALDIEKFADEAKERLEKMQDSDPLHILC